MAIQGKFGNAGDSGQGPHFTCARCEAAISDAMDNVLSADSRQAMDQHLATCAGCSRVMAEARRGQAWLDLLKAERPEPPSTLAMRILSQTSGSALPIPQAPLAVAGIPGSPATGSLWPRWAQLPSFAAIRSALYQPRLAMTAAMAFFSISLTLNMTGIKLSSIHMADLQPDSLRHQFYQADAQAIRYCDNLRVVYEVESSVQKIRRVEDSPVDDRRPLSAPSPNGDTPRHQTQPADPDGSSHRDVPSRNHNASTSGPQLADPRFRLARTSLTISMPERSKA
jgi:hypothetical protein